MIVYCGRCDARRYPLPWMFVIVAPSYGPRADLFAVADPLKGCAADYTKFCNPRYPGAKVQASCLRQYWVNLSASCRRTLQNHKNGDADGSGDDSTQ
jgi:hypothetical protein